MKYKFVLGLLAAGVIAPTASAQEGLYYMGSESQESLPLQWTVGTNFIWDDNPTPTAVGPGASDEATSVNPYVGVSFVSITPQDTLDVYARVGAIYYFDQPTTATDDIYPQARAGVNWSRDISERLRFSSRNVVAYELEPDYSYGFATSRQVDPYLYWRTDNSVGFRWTERFATYTGFRLTGLDYDSAVRNSDRFTYSLYNQFRYQLSPQSVLTFDYRYSDTEADGAASDRSSHFFLAGVEHRFSPNTILIAKGGAQVYESDGAGGNDGTEPFVELAVRSQINSQLSLRAFTRYSNEVYDTTRFVGGVPINFDNRQTLRVGVSGEYEVSQMVNLFGGINYIPATFDEGRVGATPVGGEFDEDLLNAHIGVSVKFTDYLYGTASYNYTDSDSDFVGQSYDRNRISLGIRAEFD